MNDAAQQAGAAVGEAVGVMLHPETFGSIAKGYTNPFAGYVAGRAEFQARRLAPPSPPSSRSSSRTSSGHVGRGSRGPRRAGAGRRLLGTRSRTSAAPPCRRPGTERIAELGEKIIAATPTVGLPMFAGWREMPLADDPGTALQVMHVMRELRGDVHFNVLANSGITPVEAHMLHGDENYTRMFGWPEPSPTARTRRSGMPRSREATTNPDGRDLRRAALTVDEAEELARLSGGRAGVAESRRPGLGISMPLSDGEVFAGYTIASWAPGVWVSVSRRASAAAPRQGCAEGARNRRQPR